MAKIFSVVILLSCIALGWISSEVTDWGFYAHRKINYNAVFSVPPPLNQFFKKNINYLSVHAVNPDQRRYSVPAEGPRHFIDLDKWMAGDSLILTKDYTLDRILQGGWTWEIENKTLFLQPGLAGGGRIKFIGESLELDLDSFALHQEVYKVPMDSMVMISPSFYPDYKGRLFFIDSFTLHGIVPYYVERMYGVLVRQMMERDLTSVLRTSADLGHYISDAHVPLHTTSNYNGQFTGQIGIHAFWESRIPELFETSDFSSLVGRAEHIGDINDFIWNVVDHSFGLVDIVLKKELEARQAVRIQNHYCYEERGNSLVRTQCPELARAYMVRMNGMVQNQWRSAILAVGSVWYSAWIDAGKPDLWTEQFNAEPDTGIIERIRQFIDRSKNPDRNQLH